MARYFKVQDDGSAPAGLKVGDCVVTAGGIYEITGTGNPDNANGYYSKLLDDKTTVANFKGTYATLVTRPSRPVKK